ncbi:MAG: hypothetical protein KAX49_20995 [Halanaerobiales bacterium]|nr:hypothetical protein [Halanaerobiales bacterium]
MKILQSKVKKSFLLVLNISILIINIILATYLLTNLKSEEILLILPTKYDYLVTEIFVLNENYKQVKDVLEENGTEFIKKNGILGVAFGSSEYQFMFYNEKLQAIYLLDYNGLEEIFPQRVP